MKSVGNGVPHPRVTSFAAVVQHYNREAEEQNCDPVVGVIATALVDVRKLVTNLGLKVVGLDPPDQ